MGHHDILRTIVKRLPEDYDPWGTNERWKDPDKSYPDCSGGCKHYYELKDRDNETLGADWGVCANPKSHRCGLLTFEHQGCEHAE
jgi:hypothetical protein